MIHGVLNIYKERGYTSHDVVAKLRGIIGQKKIGHTGTLDPDAEGVLPVCLGKATRLCDMLTDQEKEYEAALLLGTTTDTQDITGRVLEQKPADDLTEQEVRDCIRTYVGTIYQIPPMYSALKVNGRKLCDLAREGKTVERKSRPVTVYDITILEMRLPRVKMRVRCSKGTYIRTLCHDIGQSLGTGGCMEELLRTRAGRFEISESLVLAEIEKLVREGSLGNVLIPTDQMFAEYDRVTLKAAASKLAHNGNVLRPKHFCGARKWNRPENLRVYDDEGRFVGIYAYCPETGEVKLKKMFYLPQ